MTVYSLETAKALVDEINTNKVTAVYSYRHSLTNDLLFAVFTKNSIIDIYDSPFCKDVKLLFENGKWNEGVIV